MSVSLQFVVPTSELHGGIRVPLELASWLTDLGSDTEVPTMVLGLRKTGTTVSSPAFSVAAG